MVDDQRFVVGDKTLHIQEGDTLVVYTDYFLDPDAQQPAQSAVVSGDGAGSAATGCSGSAI